jgi:hypothetical protein
VSKDGYGIWANYDEERHGRYEEHIDDPFYAEGFVWSCCKEFSDVKTCSASKHSMNEDTASKRSRVRRVS